MLLIYLVFLSLTWLTSYQTCNPCNPRSKNVGIDNGSEESRREERRCHSIATTASMLLFSILGCLFAILATSSVFIALRRNESGLRMLMSIFLPEVFLFQFFFDVSEETSETSETPKSCEENSTAAVSDAINDAVLKTTTTTTSPLFSATSQPSNSLKSAGSRGGTGFFEDDIFTARRSSSSQSSSS